MKFIRENPKILRAWIDGNKELYEEYLAANPSSLFPAFLKEIRDAGIEFEVGEQILDYMPERKRDIVPIAMNYCILSRASKNEEEERHFLEFFNYEGLDEVVQLLLDRFCSDDTSELTRELIAECLYTIRSKEYLKECSYIITQPSFGKHRRLIILLLGELKSTTVIPDLVKLLEDETVRTHTIAALSKFEREDFRPLFERFKDAEHPGWRKYSREAIAQLDKLKNKQANE